jgi:serine phosphatase RsbU (regulator of sigma subunit)
MSGPHLIESLIDIAGILYLMPFAVVGVLWLLAATEFQVILDNGILLAAGALIAFAFKRLYFTLRLEVRSGVFALISGSFETLIYWSMVLMLGPTSLWIAVAAALLEWLWPSGPGASHRWHRLRNLASGLATTTVSGLAAFSLFGYLGGSIPLEGDVGPLIGPVAAATLAWVVLSKVLILPLLLYASRSPELVGSGSLTDQASLTRFLLVGSLISNIADPFAILGALLYSELGLGPYAVLIAGAMLSAFLANRLSHSAARGEQRNRELAVIESLSSAIMTRPATVANLREVLGEQVRGLFPGSFLEIRLYADEVLYRNMREGFIVDDAIWDRLRSGDHTLYQPPSVTLSDGMPAWQSFAVSIPHADGDRAIGGIYLLWDPRGNRYPEFGQALSSLAYQIASALRRIELQQEALDEQAEAYQKEVYAQAYQAQVYAQALTLEKMTQELEVAGQIQASFLPAELPDVPGWQMAVTLEPAREASGDFYDLIELPNGRFGLVIADVADKGMGAALYMALSRTLIRTYAVEHDGSPELALAAANRRILADTTTDLFVTVFYAILDTATGVLSYCNAGHNPPYLIQSQNGNKPVLLNRTALPLGITEEASWERAEVELAPGDVLAMYTDGVTEAQDEDEAFFGEERLLKILQANVRRSAEVIEEKVITAVYDFAGEAPQFDDITMMVITRR